MTTLTPINSPEAIQTRLVEGRIPRYGPMLMLFARSFFILFAQGITFLLFLQLNIPNASVVIRNWWPVYGTLVDFGCLGLLAWLTRRESIRLLDLVGFVKNKLKTEIPFGLGLFIVIAPVSIFGGGMLAQLIAYGRLNPVFPEYTFMRTLPLFALIYARILWWPIWSVIEEMTYNGYALPRLVAITKSRWLSVTIVSFFFAIQHSFLMLAGFQFGLYMFLAFLPLSIAIVLVYLRIRRLPPLIIAHWLMDLSNVLFLYQVGTWSWR
ncbi:MAG TPA: CPBP family intramembrane glutamic endopeptidase [Leptolinea sp.]